MKKVNLEIFLSDNEAFEEEIRELIRGKVRSIVRSEVSTIMEEEAKAETQRVIDSINRTKSYYSYHDLGCRLSSILGEKIREALPKAIKEMDFISIVNEKSEEILKDGRIKRMCEEAINKQITEAATNKIKQILSI